MEEIREMVELLLKKCKGSNVPIMIAYGAEKTFLAEYGTVSADTPDRIRRARTAFVNAPSQARSIMEFDA